jgi:hypothetical protein
VDSLTRRFLLPIVASAATAALIAVGYFAWPADDPYANWPTQGGTVAEGMQAELFDGKIPHPNMMITFTCTPDGMRVDQRALVDTDQKPSWWADIFRDAAYPGEGLCSAIWRWRIPEHVVYSGLFASELKPDAPWTELGRGWSALPGDGDAFVEPGKVQVLLVEVHQKGLPLGEPIHIGTDGSVIPPHP